MVFRAATSRTRENPAAAWATAAVPGAPLGVAGGASLGERPAGYLLLAGDETALPAISRILAEAAPTTVGTALLEVAGPAEEQPLDAPAGMTVRWLHRGDVSPGESALLADAVAAIDRPAGDDLFAWVGAESATVRTITPPSSFGRSLLTISRSRARCSLFSILRLTPTFEAYGM